MLMVKSGVLEALVSVNPTTSRTFISAKGEMLVFAIPGQPTASCTSGVAQLDTQSPASSPLSRLLYCCNMFTLSNEKQAFAVLEDEQELLLPAAELRVPLL